VYHHTREARRKLADADRRQNSPIAQTKIQSRPEPDAIEDDGKIQPI